MHIAAIVEIALTVAAADKLSHNAYTRAVEFAKGLNVTTHFKAVVANDKYAVVAACREQMKTELVNGWLSQNGVKAEHFRFRVVDVEVKDGQFWRDLTGTGSTQWHYVGDAS